MHFYVEAVINCQLKISQNMLYEYGFSVAKTVGFKHNNHAYVLESFLGGFWMQWTL